MGMLANSCLNNFFLIINFLCFLSFVEDNNISEKFMKKDMENCIHKKNGEALKSLMGHIMGHISKKLPRVSDGFGILVWRVISSAHNLITVVQTVRRKLHKTLNNICTILC
jgi:hypothetical protein